MYYGDELNQRTPWYTTFRFFVFRIFLGLHHRCVTTDSFVRELNVRTTITTRGVFGRHAFPFLCLTLLEPQFRFRDKPLKFQVVCPQNGTAVLKGLIDPLVGLCTLFVRSKKSHRAFRENPLTNIDRIMPAGGRHVLVMLHLVHARRYEMISSLGRKYNVLRGRRTGYFV